MSRHTKAVGQTLFMLVLALSAYFPLVSLFSRPWFGLDTVDARAYPLIVIGLVMVSGVAVANRIVSGLAGRTPDKGE